LGRATCIEERKTPECPLCRKPVSNLVANILVKQAIDALKSNPIHPLENAIKDLTSEEQDEVQRAIETIKNRRLQDIKEGIPHRLSKPQSFARKAIKAISTFYGYN